MARMPQWGTSGVAVPFVVLALAATAAAAKSSDEERAKELGLALTKAPALRQPRGGGVVGDVYAHNNVAESWGDPTILAHEGTHGANSVIRNRYGGWDRCNAMYVCHDLAIVIDEPRLSLKIVARYIPGSMRGGSYNLYFGAQSLSSWEYNTIYLFDEWSCYVNCTWAGAERGRAGGSDARQMSEFTIYALAALEATVANKPDYDIKQMRAAIAWMCERRVMPLLRKPGAEEGMQHWQRFKTSPDTARLRQFIRGWFGEAWTKEVLGF